MLDCLPVDVDRIVGRAAAGRRHVGDEARIPDASGVDAVLRPVVVGEQLARHLRDAVHRPRPADRVLRRRIMGRFGTEDPDGARCEDGEILVACELEKTDHAVDADVPCRHGLRLAHGRENGRHIEDRVDGVVFDGPAQAVRVEKVDDGRRTAFGERGGQRRATAACGHGHVAAAPEFGDELGADLACRADHEDVLHGPSFQSVVRIRIARVRGGTGCSERTRKKAAPAPCGAEAALLERAPGELSSRERSASSRRARRRP